MWRSERILNTLTNYSSSITHSSFLLDASNVTEDDFEIPTRFEDNVDEREHYIWKYPIRKMTAWELSDVWYRVIYSNKEEEIDQTEIYKTETDYLVNFKNKSKNEAKHIVEHNIKQVVKLLKSNPNGKLIAYFNSTLTEDDEDKKEDEDEYKKEQADYYIEDSGPPSAHKIRNPKSVNGGNRSLISISKFGSNLDRGIMKIIQNEYYIQILRSKFNLNIKPDSNKAIFIYHTGSHYETLTLPEYHYIGKGIPLLKVKENSGTIGDPIELSDDEEQKKQKYKVLEKNIEFYKNNEDYNDLDKLGMLRYGVYMLWWSLYEYYDRENMEKKMNDMTIDDEVNNKFLMRIFHPDVLPNEGVQGSVLDSKYWGGSGVYEMLSMLLGITICVYSDTNKSKDWGIYTPDGKSNRRRPFEIDGSYYMLDKFETKKNYKTLEWGDPVAEPENGVRLKTTDDGNCLYHSIIQALSHKTITIPNISNARIDKFEIEERVILKHCYCNYRFNGDAKGRKAVA